MFSIFQKKIHHPPDLSEVHCDVHSHLIPGIDDGAADMDTSLQLIRGMHELGYKKLITTPHIMWEMFKNSREKILTAYHAVQTTLQQNNIPVELLVAAEYYLDDHFEELLTKDEPLLTLTGNLVLIEFSFIRQPIDLKDTLFKLQIKGYQPVIAHPERYLYFGVHKNWYDDMKGQGCLFQLNLLSLCGYYGRKQEELAHYLIRKKYVDLIGTDLHNARHLQILKSSSSIMDAVKKILDTGMIQNPQL
jgi:tyrosine-protein phosphatase YwqE